MGRAAALLVLIALVAVPAMASWAQDCGENLAPGPDTSRAKAEALPEVQLKVDTVFAYCAIEMTGSYDQHNTAFTKLYSEAAQQGIFGGTPFGVYYNSPSDTPVEKLKWEVGFAVAAGQAVKEPLTLKKWNYTTMAVLDYNGEFGGEAEIAAFGAVYKWIGENGFRPAGPLMEQFLNVPTQDEKGAYIGRVEITVPVEKAPPAQGKKTK